VTVFAPGGAAPVPQPEGSNGEVHVPEPQAAAVAWEDDESGPTEVIRDRLTGVIPGPRPRSKKPFVEAPAACSRCQTLMVTNADEQESSGWIIRDDTGLCRTAATRAGSSRWARTFPSAATPADGIVMQLRAIPGPG
jgi:hypothetical protein